MAERELSPQVLFGDVFVCAGQSNMALPVDATYNMQAKLGLGRIVALHCRSSTSYHIC